jgi:hypothetical protein
MSSSEFNRNIFDCAVSHRKDGNPDNKCRENIKPAAERSYVEIRNYKIRDLKRDTNMFLRCKRHGND